mgnify:CR=1 FL=1
MLVLLIHLLGHLLELFGLCASLGHMEQLFGMAFRSWKPGCSRRTIVRKPGFQPGCACIFGTIVRVFSLAGVKKKPRPAKISEEKQVRAWEFWRKFATFSYTDTPNHYICQPAVRIPKSEIRRPNNCSGWHTAGSHARILLPLPAHKTEQFFGFLSRSSPNLLGNPNIFY